MALSVPLSRFTPRVGGGSACFVRPLDSFMPRVIYLFIGLVIYGVSLHFFRTLRSVRALLSEQERRGEIVRADASRKLRDMRFVIVGGFFVGSGLIFKWLNWI